ncbi:hypothetical protein FXF51_05810 [Nonomuraea sp. PA05]|uniref:hypothetical protein n=1 Tax=Nonomuraea sp. PA05 TaxID=2604466 RepID=UPI0011D48A97|nr:hypothetical protein [Nonomuraea sp. PA05]TYB69675.1 hypothetical protein FXF51_05810 [Nonomuraea sp. PA05]
MAEHPHGSAHRYRSGGCRCPRCTAAHARAQNVYRLAVKTGDHRPDAEAEKVRRHVQTLRDAGMSLRQIAIAAGVSKGVVDALIYGVPSQGRRRSSRIRPANADKLLAVQPRQQAGAA